VAYTSEIDKLEQRWAENPKGRNFAPLADAYRKAGELDKALELCTAGLELHPDYVSAHIVFGRCLIDQKNETGASDVFRKVLALDPENVLALKILADIAERGGRFDEAVDWLGRLLLADPMNGDAAEVLARAKRKAAQAAPRAAPEPVARLVPEAAPHPPRPVARPGPPHATPPASLAPSLTPLPQLPPPPPPAPAVHPDFVIERESEAPPPPALDVKGAPADIETFDGTLDFNAMAHDAARSAGLEVHEEVEFKPQDLVVEGLAHTQYESGLFAAPPDTASPEDEPKIDLPLIMPDDLAPLAADEAAPAAPEHAASAPRTPLPPPSPASPPSHPAMSPPAAVVLSDDDGAADTAALSRAEPVLTETMADLYLRQGHQEEALRVYQALLAQRPGDARLRGRVESLTRGGKREEGLGGEGGTGETVQVFLRRILAGRPGVPAAGASVSAPGAGSPLDEAFAIAHSDVEREAPGVISPGEATRPATDSISLDQVFGDDGPRTLPPAAAVPAAPSAGAAPAGPASSSQQTGGFSFDQFFSAPEPAAGDTAATPSEGGTTPQPSTRNAGGRLRPPVEDEGDLDQFQAWLRGLKS
jgi:tetratricopeptide (TPR) repeat protein